MGGDIAGSLVGLLAGCQLADATGDPWLRTSLWIGPSIVCSFTGPLDDGLRATETVLSLCHETLSWGPGTWATAPFRPHTCAGRASWPGWGDSPRPGRR